jgi:hypothetical protein
MRLIDLLASPEELERVAPADVPALLGELAVVDAKLRLRLMVVEAPKRKENARFLTPDEAASIASADVKWLLRATRGLPFRHKPTAKVIRFAEAEFRDWLEGRHQ